MRFPLHTIQTPCGAQAPYGANRQSTMKKPYASLREAYLSPCDAIALCSAMHLVVQKHP